MSNIPLCYKYVTIINPNNCIKLEKDIIFTSSLQINLIQYCHNYILMALLKVAKKHFIKSFIEQDIIPKLMEFFLSL